MNRMGSPQDALRRKTCPSYRTVILSLDRSKSLCILYSHGKRHGVPMNDEKFGMLYGNHIYIVNSRSFSVIQRLAR